MENDFNTTLEDNSALEISRELVRLFNIFKTSGLPAVESEVKSLPPVTEWLDVVPRREKTVECESSDEEMEEEEGDPEWTTVSYKRR